MSEAWARQAAAAGGAAGGGKRRRVEGGGGGASARWALREQQFGQQYASVYYSRLLRLRPDAQAAAAARWDAAAAPLAEGISALRQGAPAVVVGTVYKVMRLKPSILDEYKKKSSAAALLAGPRRSCVADSDSLVLEDDSGRVPLELAPAVAARHPVASFVSGVVVAVRGRESSKGSFVAEDLLFAGLAPQPQPRARAPGPGPRFVALVSGLAVGAPAEELDPLAAQLLADYVAGAAGGDADHETAARVERVVLAGNSLFELPVDEDAKYKRRKSGVDRLVSPLRELDALVAQLAAAVPVDVMPGTTDPANYTLPQQPLHHCLFPLSRTYPNFRLLTNPAQVECSGGVRVAGHAGQPTADMARFSRADDASELLERTLRWRHLAPSAPDTLACYPFQDRDPFVIDESPHVLFAGNQPAFSTRLVEEGEGDEARRVRVVAVPSFARTQTFVLVDLASENLDCHEVHLSTPAFEARAAAEAARAAKEAESEAAAAAAAGEEEEEDEIPEPDGGEEGGDEEA